VEYWIRFNRCQRCIIGGNNEELFFEYIHEGSTGVLEHGGQATIDSYQEHGWKCCPGDPRSIPANHNEFYLQSHHWTRPLLATPEFVFTHAGYDFSRDKKNQNPYDLRWGRVKGWKPGCPTVVRGHTPQRTVRFGEGIIQVDTGCGLGGPLSCVELISRQVTQEWPAGCDRDAWYRRGLQCR
jgi:hypothetical protein